MTRMLQTEFSEFAWNLGCSTGFIESALRGNEAALEEFASRGISKEKLVQASEAMKDIAGAFYTAPQPV